MDTTILVIWAFMTFMSYDDGSTAMYPASFKTQEKCETFRGNLAQWLTDNHEKLGIASASWTERCDQYRVQVSVPPLVPQSDGHSY